MRFCAVIVIGLLILVGQWEGLARAGVTPAVREVVSEAIRGHVAQRLALPASGLRVTVISLLADLDVQSVAGVREATGGATVYAGDRGTFGVALVLANGSTETVWATARIERLVPVTVTTRALDRREVIAEGDVAAEIRAVGLRSPASPPIESLVGKRSVRGMTRGSPIDLDDVEEAPVIQRGDTVMLIVDSGGLRIVTKGRAKEDGYPGRQVAVVNVDSRRLVHGEVLSDGSVAVRLGP